MRPKGNYARLQRRRTTAIDLQKKGLSVFRVSKRMEINRSSIYRWNKLFYEMDYSGLAPQRIPGRPSKLTREQMRALSQILQKPVEKIHPDKKFWSTILVTKLIKKHFNVSYDTAHVWRLMLRLGWRYERDYYTSDYLKRGVKVYPNHRGRWKKKEF